MSQSVSESQSLAISQKVIKNFFKDVKYYIFINSKGQKHPEKTQGRF